MSRTPEELRAEAVGALMGPGGERRELMAKVVEVDSRLRPLVRSAIEARVPQMRIVEITGLARGTVREWSKAPAS
jgi:hypothetical protein